MKQREKRIKALQSQLLEMYSDLFGAQFNDDAMIDEGTEFQAIIERFKEKHFYIRQLQRERQKKEKKGQGKAAEQIQKNQKIREELKKCEKLLSDAGERMKNDIKKIDEGKIEKVIGNREKILNECYEMIANSKTVEFGDKFQPPKKAYASLQQFKKKRIDNLPPDEIDLKHQLAFERFQEKDNIVEELVTQVRNVNKEIHKELIGTSNAIGLTRELIDKNTKKVERVNVKVTKGTADLRQVLKNYRRPSKLCLDVLLILLLLALIGVIINMLKSSSI